MFRMPSGLGPGNYSITLKDSGNHLQFTVIRKAMNVKRVPTGLISNKYTGHLSIVVGQYDWIPVHLASSMYCFVK
jgi:hypothetical protein